MAGNTRLDPENTPRAKLTERMVAGNPTPNRLGRSVDAGPPGASAPSPRVGVLAGDAP